MPTMGWWIYVIGVPLSGGALLTLLSVGGKAKKSAKSSKPAPQKGRVSAPRGAKSGHSTAAKPVARRAKAAELPPLFLAQNFLLIWSLNAVLATPFHPQNANPLLLTIILVAIAMVSLVMLAAAGWLFLKITPTDASSISVRGHLEGLIGECDAAIDYRRGSVLVRDEFGTLHHFAARSETPIAVGESILLLEYDREGDYFQVRSWNE